MVYNFFIAGRAVRSTNTINKSITYHTISLLPAGLLHQQAPYSPYNLFISGRAVPPTNTLLPMQFLYLRQICSNNKHFTSHAISLSPAYLLHQQTRYSPYNFFTSGKLKYCCCSRNFIISLSLGSRLKINSSEGQSPPLPYLSLRGINVLSI